MSKFLALLAISVVLAGCTAFSLGEPYNKAIDDELNTYQKSSAEFIKAARQNAGNNKGLYGSDESKKFYAASAASLSNLQLRADVLSGRQCPTSRVAQIGKALDLDMSSPSAESKAVEAAGNIEPLDVSGNCMSILVRGVRIAHYTLEADHKELGRLTATAAELNSMAIDAAVRVSLLGIRSKQY